MSKLISWLVHRGYDDRWTWGSYLVKTREQRQRLKQRLLGELFMGNFFICVKDAPGYLRVCYLERKFESDL
jgi:hypothetical protein